MTLTAGPATPAGNDLSLMGHSILMSTKQQSDATDRPQAIKQDFPSVLGKLLKLIIIIVVTFDDLISFI